MKIAEKVYNTLFIKEVTLHSNDEKNKEKYPHIMHDLA